jgi:hypothetical protein
VTEPVRSPRDLTGSVMRRLGLPGITPRDARRRRRRRAALRLAICLAVAGAAGLVAAVAGRTAPQAPQPTIPSAVRNDLEQYQRTIDRTVLSIRSLSLPPGEGVEQ